MMIRYHTPHKKVIGLENNVLFVSLRDRTKLVKMYLPVASKSM